jgi:hypothetical protein
MNLSRVVSGRMRRALEGRENSDAVASCLEVVEGVVLELMRDLMKDRELSFEEKGRLASCLSGVARESSTRENVYCGRAGRVTPRHAHFITLE